MISTCKKCNTSFNLSERLIKPRGSKVRCSKCQYIYVVYPPVTEQVAKGLSPSDNSGDIKMPSGAEKKTEIIPEPNIEDFDLTDLKIERKGPEDAVPGEDINKKPMENSRKYKRNKYPREVVFTVEGVEYHGFIDNMGAAGLFIRTDESLSVGKAVELTFPLSNKANQVKFFAEIVRTTDDGIGVTFLKSRGKPL